MLEQQAAEIERLNDRWAEWKDSLNSVMEQRNALQAKLSAMESQEPVAWAFKVNKFHRHVEFYCPSDDGYDEGTLQPLYTAPKVAQPSKPTFAEWCATNWDGPPSANARDAYNRIIGGQQP